LENSIARATETDRQQEEIMSIVTGNQELTEDAEITPANMLSHPGSSHQVGQIRDSPRDINVFCEDGISQHMYSGRKSSELRRVIFED